MNYQQNRSYSAKWLKNNSSAIENFNERKAIKKVNYLKSYLEISRQLERSTIIANYRWTIYAGRTFGLFGHWKYEKLVHASKFNFQNDRTRIAFPGPLSVNYLQTSIVCFILALLAQRLQKAVAQFSSLFYDYYRHLLHPLIFIRVVKKELRNTQHQFKSRSVIYGLNVIISIFCSFSATWCI